MELTDEDLRRIGEMMRAVGCSGDARCSIRPLRQPRLRLDEVRRFLPGRAGGGVVEDVISGSWVYRFGEQQLNLHGPGVEPNEVAKVPVPPGGSDLCFEWPGPVEEARAYLERLLGVEVEMGPVERFGARGSGMSVYLRDPDGSLLEFISYSDRRES